MSNKFENVSDGDLVRPDGLKGSASARPDNMDEILKQRMEQDFEISKKLSEGLNGKGRK